MPHCGCIQEVLPAAVRRLADFFANRPCSVFIAPFAVRLATGKYADDQIFTVVQPDISIVCDKTKLDKNGCISALNLDVEVISPATASRDHIQKIPTILTNPKPSPKLKN